MKVIIILLAFLALMTFTSCNKHPVQMLSTQELKELSPLEVNNMINDFMIKLEKTEDELLRKEYLSQINVLLALEAKHLDQSSWFYKIKSIVTFANIIALLMIFFLIVFIVSLCKDIIVTFSLMTIQIIAKLLNGYYKFYFGYVVLGLLLAFDPQYVQFIGSNTLVFYLISFYCLSSWHLDVVCERASKKIMMNYLEGLLSITTIVTILHDNYICGIGSVILLLLCNGCRFNKIQCGFAIGFDGKESLKSTRILCIILTIVFVLLRMDLVNVTGFMTKIMLFETGTLFWCPLFCFVACLILCDNVFDLVENIKTMVILLCHLFAGFLIQNNSLINLSTLFLILWLFSFEWRCIKKIGIRKIWIVCLIILINLYALYYCAMNYPMLLLLE